MNKILKENRDMSSILIEYLENAENGNNLKEEIAKGIIKKAMDGNVRAFETIAKFIGEYPALKNISKLDKNR